MENKLMSYVMHNYDHIYYRFNYRIGWNLPGEVHTSMYEIWCDIWCIYKTVIRSNIDNMWLTKSNTKTALSPKHSA